MSDSESDEEGQAGPVVLKFQSKKEKKKVRSMKQESPESKQFKFNAEMHKEGEDEGWVDEDD
jgi:hypothetical protein